MYEVSLAVALFVGLVICLQVGYLVGAERVKKHPKAHEGIGAVEAAVFGLFGLLLSLSFFGAASRLDARRHLIINEANAITAAYMRVDLLPNAEQPDVRRLFREYLDARIHISQMPDETISGQELRNAARLQQEIWSRAISAGNKDSSGGARLLLPAINEMIGIAGAEAIAADTHLPGLVFALLIAGALLSGLVAGFGMARGQRNRLLVLAYAAIVTMTIYVMLDMESPRGGLIHVGAADRAMINLRDSIR